MIEDRKLTRTVMLRCNNGEYNSVVQVADVQLRWMSELPEVDPNPLGMVCASPWRLVAASEWNKELEDAAAEVQGTLAAAVHQIRQPIDPNAAPAESRINHGNRLKGKSWPLKSGPVKPGVV